MNDAELGLVEQVTYIDADVVYAALGKEKPENASKQIPFKLNKGETLGHALNRILGPNAVKNLRAQGDKSIGGSLNSGKEWANIIENIQKDDNIKNLKVVDTDTQGKGGKHTNLAIAYEDPKHPGKAIISYKGTSGHDEWHDNVKGFNSADTPRQKRAAEFAKKITGNPKYTDVTVTGHSKGANKAMYVTIVDESGKIHRCVAFDGQGFSNEFLEKYAKQIEAKAGNITNYSIDRDFVHVLMKQIPGSYQPTCAGYGMKNGAEYHSPVSFFITDENGNFLLDENGLPYFNVTNKENPLIGGIRNFTQYVMDNSTPWELETIVDTLGPFAGYLLGDKDLGAALKSMASNPIGWMTILVKLYEFRIENGISTIDMVKFIIQFIPDFSTKTVLLIGAVALGFVTLLHALHIFAPVLFYILEGVAALLALILLVAFVIALVKELVKLLVAFVKELIKVVKAIIHKIVEAIKYAWNKFVSFVKYAAGKIRDFTEAFLAKMLEVFCELASAAVETFKEIGETLISHPEWFMITICGNVDAAVAISDSMANDKDEYESSIRSLFQKANEADDRYAQVVNSTATKIDDLTSSFRTEFGIA